MKNKKALLSVLLLCLFLCRPAPVAAAPAVDIPVLTSIQFKNGRINQPFDPSVFTYSLTLENNQVAPTLESYTMDGSANIFITYVYDSANHQTGVRATLEYAAGSVIYTFTYSNPAPVVINSENRLSAVSCILGEIKPAVNSRDTSYKLYIPKDLTTIRLMPVPADIHAYCAPVEMLLSEDQEPVISMTVTASDGSSRAYSFKVKRVDKTVAQVLLEMQAPDYVSFVEGTEFYEQQPFLVLLGASACGIAVLAVLFFCTRRITANVYDPEEKSFYS